VTVETRSASVSVARFKDPQPSRTIGMIWRKTSPLAEQLLQLSEVVCRSATTLRTQHNQVSPPRDSRHARRSERGSSPKNRTLRQKQSASNL
jgi:LysR family transcriptional regulator, hydrogen peroxide-inducible genes activator